ncbi:MAG: hypothetical protein ACFB4I_20525 [Cyanophyceae cyanobacterium]
MLLFTLTDFSSPIFPESLDALTLGLGFSVCWLLQVDSDDLALVAAETLRHPEQHAGKIYPLGYDTATMSEVAEFLTEVIGQPYRVENHSPDEFLANMLELGAEPIYIHCVYTQFKLNIANKIPNADATFNNFEAITRRKPTSWREFVAKNHQQLQY